MRAGRARDVEGGASAAVTDRPPARAGRYVRCGTAAGTSVDALAPRFSFFFGIGMNFYMEVGAHAAQRAKRARRQPATRARRAQRRLDESHRRPARPRRPRPRALRPPAPILSPPPPPPRQYSAARPAVNPPAPFVGCAGGEAARGAPAVGPADEEALRPEEGPVAHAPHPLPDLGLLPHRPGAPPPGARGEREAERNRG